MTRAGWATTLPRGACTGPGRASPSGAAAARPCWAPARLAGWASTWTSTPAFWPSTASPTATPTSSTATRPSLPDPSTRVSGSGRGQDPRCWCANWTEIGTEWWPPPGEPDLGNALLSCQTPFSAIRAGVCTGSFFFYLSIRHVTCMWHACLCGSIMLECCYITLNITLM